MGTALLGDVSVPVAFAKFHGAGNDFVVVDAAALPEDIDRSELAAAICERHTGVGADGLLIATTFPERVGMAIFNADGSEDTMCGNGVRCLIRHLRETHGLPPEGTVSTLSGPVRYRMMVNGDVEVDLPEPKWTPSAIPATVPTVLGVEVAGVRMDLVNTGSAHAVVHVARLPSRDEIAVLSRPIENDPAFPEKISVMWTRVEARDRVRIAIWERGVGQTLACGTGAVAAVVASARRGLVDGVVDVVSPGGTVRVRWDGEENRPSLAGPATRVFTGVFPFEPAGGGPGKGRSACEASGTMPA